jgi:hypothetical protein
MATKSSGEGAVRVRPELHPEAQSKPPFSPRENINWEKRGKAQLVEKRNYFEARQKRLKIVATTETAHGLS